MISIENAYKTKLPIFLFNEMDGFTECLNEKSEMYDKITANGGYPIVLLHWEKLFDVNSKNNITYDDLLKYSTVPLHEIIGYVTKIDSYGTADVVITSLEYSSLLREIINRRYVEKVVLFPRMRIISYSKNISSFKDNEVPYSDISCDKFAGWFGMSTCDKSALVKLTNLFENKDIKLELIKSRRCKQLVTSPEKYETKYGEVSCFLAGGITDCEDWQNKVFSIIRKIGGCDTLICYNPRREKYDVKDPKASEKQIAWEFDYLSKMDIFSMYFSDSKSVQPICLYELGRQLSEMKRRFPYDYLDRIIITVEEGYSRTQDVVIQSKLALGIDIVDIYKRGESYYEHAIKICRAYKKLNKNT